MSYRPAPIIQGDGGGEGKMAAVEGSIVEDDQLKRVLTLVVSGAAGVATIYLAYRLGTSSSIRSHLRRIGSALGILTPSPRVVLSPSSDRVALPLSSVTRLSHNVARFRFSLPHPAASLGVSAGQHVTLAATVNGKRIVRMYSPVSSEHCQGYVEFVIKRYDNPNALSRHIHSLQPGDMMDFSGPRGHVRFLGEGRFELKKGREWKAAGQNGRYDHVTMIAGGTGITPMMQIIEKSMADEGSKVKLFLLFANSTEEDVFLKDELMAIAALNPHRFKLCFTVSRAGTGWTHARGRPDESANLACLFSPSSDHVVLLCGPTPMVDSVKAKLAEAGHQNEDIIVF